MLVIADDPTADIAIPLDQVMAHLQAGLQLWGVTSGRACQVPTGSRSSGVAQRVTEAISVRLPQLVYNAHDLY
jgi:hypothetical protein